MGSAVDSRIAELEQPRVDPSTVAGWGVDADASNDPAYPMRSGVPDNKARMTWERPALQPSSVEVLQSTEHNRRTAVFGTSTPPSGLSGAIRRQAFHKSEGKWSHWLLLLFADRINVAEGVLHDLNSGRVPNIPNEMGIRSELKYNRAAFGQKVIVAGAIAVLGYVCVASIKRSVSSARVRPAPDSRKM